jgi:RNA polymerase sigma-70 factor (ECF subfamily)
LPLGTVKSRIFFTRKKLEKSLHEYSNNWYTDKITF